MARDNLPQVVAPDDPTERKLSSPPPMHPPSLRGYEANGVTGPHESSPLLHHPPRLSNNPPSTCLENDGDDEWTMPNRSTLYMIWLTLVMGGLQIAWSVELAYISPYLLSLGLPKSTLSLIWVAGPVSGVIVQPLIGMISDRSKFKWGRRRIFIVISTIGVVAGFIGMGRTREIIRWWTGRRDWDSVRDAVIVLAIASLILLDLAINATTAAARALIVDCVPTSQQNIANAWAGRMTGVGNVLGYLSGYINLPKYLPALGETQFQILCILAPASLVITVIITCLAIKEVDPDLLFTFPDQESDKGGIQIAIGMLTSISRLPRRVRQICNIQFFAWIGWFLFLIWNTTYTGEIYVRSYLQTHPPPSNRREEDLLWDDATRIASFALLLESVVALTANLVLPLFLRGRLAIRGLTLRRIWLTSHLLFAFLMWSTLFISSVEGAVTMVSAVGIGWALALWAPFALIAHTVSHISDVSRRESIASSRAGTPDLRSADGVPRQFDAAVSPLVTTGISISNPDERTPSQSTPLLAPRPTLATDRQYSLLSRQTSPQERKDEITSAGAIMGLHNVFISSPQFISTLLASVIFHFLGAGGRGDDIHALTMVEPGVETQTGGSIAWVLRVGGLGGIIAAYLTWGLAEEAEAFGQSTIE